MGLVRERLALNAASRYAGDKIVLTGGASQLLGLSGIRRQRIRQAGALGRPSDLAGLNASLSGPQLATLSGLMTVAARGSGELSAPHGRKMLNQGYLGRVGTWLKRGF